MRLKIQDSSFILICIIYQIMNHSHSIFVTSIQLERQIFNAKSVRYWNKSCMAHHATYIEALQSRSVKNSLDPIYIMNLESSRKEDRQPLLASKTRQFLVLPHILLFCASTKRWESDQHILILQPMPQIAKSKSCCINTSLVSMFIIWTVDTNSSYILI